MLKSFVAALAVAVGVGGSGTSQRELPPPQRPPTSVVGVLWDDTGAARPRLSRLKPLSLEPFGRRAPLRRGAGSATAYSDDGRLLAVGTGDPSIELIDVRRMRKLGNVKLRGTGWVTFLSWQRDTLFAVVQGQTQGSVAIVDPENLQAVRRHQLARTIIGVQEGPGTVVVLTAPRKQIGPLELTVVGGTGAVTVPLSSIEGGSWVENDGSEYRMREVRPALAVDTAGSRAIVVPAGGAVAEVSLRDLSVEYHTLSEPVSLLGRIRNWLEPAAEAKVLEGPQRKAAWLDSGLVAVTGADYSTGTTSGGDPTVEVEAAGLSLLDPADWSIRKVNGETSDFLVFPTTLMAFGDTSWGGPSAQGIGVVGYDFEGNELYRLLDGTAVSWVEPAGDLAYVTINQTRRLVLDAAAGRILGRVKPSSLLVVGS